MPVSPPPIYGPRPKAPTVEKRQEPPPLVQPAPPPLARTAPATIAISIAEVVRVIGLLDAHYVEGRYRDDWSDERVAQTLDLPVGKVAQIRNESPEHGPIKADPEIARLRSDLDAVHGMVTEMRDRLGKIERANGRVGR